MDDLARSGARGAVITELGFNFEMDCLREEIGRWVAACHEELRDPLEWQFLGGAKYFRPLTVFSCYRAGHGGPIPQQIVRSAQVVEIFHNVSLIIDDIIDKSENRRGRSTLHARFGELA